MVKGKLIDCLPITFVGKFISQLIIVSVLGISTTGSVDSTGVSTYVGIEVTNQNNFATIINKSRYPTFGSVEKYTVVE